jgi:hypothetical protein
MKNYFVYSSSHHRGRTRLFETISVAKSYIANYSYPNEQWTFEGTSFVNQSDISETKIKGVFMYNDKKI